MTMKYSPFEKLGFDKGEIVEAAIKPKPKKKKKPYVKRRPAMPYVLQAFVGKRWSLVRKDGDLVVTNAKGKQRSLDIAKYLRDGGFVRQMKIQLFGTDRVNDGEFFSTPVRWRRIDDVSHTVA